MGGAARLRRAAAVVLCMVVVVGSESRLDLVYDADLFGAVIATVEAVAALSGLACVAFDGGEGSDATVDCSPVDLLAPDVAVSSEKTLFANAVGLSEATAATQRRVAAALADASTFVVLYGLEAFNTTLRSSRRAVEYYTKKLPVQVDAHSCALPPREGGDVFATVACPSRLYGSTLTEWKELESGRRRVIVGVRTQRSRVIVGARTYGVASADAVAEATLPCDTVPVGEWRPAWTREAALSSFARGGTRVLHCHLPTWESFEPDHTCVESNAFAVRDRRREMVTPRECGISRESLSNA